MTSEHLTTTLKEIALTLGADLDSPFSEGSMINVRKYAVDEVFEFKRDLVEVANEARIVLLDQSLDKTNLKSFLKEIEIPLIVFLKTGVGFAPIIIKGLRKGRIQTTRIEGGETASVQFDDIKDRLILDSNGEVLALGAFSYKSLVSEQSGDEETQNISPVKRLFRLLSSEKRDIVYVFIYAAFVGIVSLTLPLGIQATVELVSGGVVFSSIYLLIGLVLLGVLAAGGLQVMQITLVEFLQRRIFTKAALEFTFRIPRMKIESLSNLHAPELVNRFFDVLTIQKGLPKLLGDLMSGIIQILFGLLLLSFYHPFFVFFGLTLVLTLILIFRLTGPRGLQSSIRESQYKYKVVYWLEEIARSLNSFKISGNTALPLRKTEYNVNNYLINRKAHFKVLMSQYIYIVLFKAVITGGLLIIGTSLVIDRQITLGQFVASEVIIILILNSVEKIITYMDVVYDMLTAVDKISQVTDLPLEKTGGVDLGKSQLERGFSVNMKDVNYSYPGDKMPAIHGIQLDLKSGEKVCISGGNDSGKTTLTNTLSGINQGYDGAVTINNYSLRDLDLTNLRDKVAKNVSQEDIFEGTLLDNILVGKPHVSTEDAVEAIQKVGLDSKINMLPEGLNTSVLSGGKGFSSSFVHKLILARCLVKRPRLMILNDFFASFQKSEKENLIKLVTEMEECTLVAVSNDPLVMEACGRTIVMEAGTIKTEGTYGELLSKGHLNEIIKV